MNRKLLEEGLAELGLNPVPAGGESSHRIGLLERYFSEIELWNSAYGLVNASGDEILIRHILDSLAPLNILRGLAHGSVADAGSGAGLPGIPLSIFMPESSFALIERSGKRCRFLENQQALLGLVNVVIMEKGIEETSEKFNLVVFRAFRPLVPPVLKALFALLTPGGLLAAYKGKQKKIDEELGLISDLLGKTEIIRVKTPFLKEERHLVIIAKRKCPSNL